MKLERIPYREPPETSRWRVLSFLAAKSGTDQYQETLRTRCSCRFLQCLHASRNFPSWRRLETRPVLRSSRFRSSRESSIVAQMTGGESSRSGSGEYPAPPNPYE